MQGLTLWPSGLRRNVKAVVFIGVGSNPTGVIFLVEGSTTLLPQACFMNLASGPIIGGLIGFALDLPLLLFLSCLIFLDDIINQQTLYPPFRNGEIASYYLINQIRPFLWAIMIFFSCRRLRPLFLTLWSSGSLSLSLSLLASSSRTLHRQQASFLHCFLDHHLSHLPPFFSFCLTFNHNYYTRIHIQKNNFLPLFPHCVTT